LRNDPKATWLINASTVKLKQRLIMSFDLHHAHLFTSDIDATIAWWCRHLQAKVILDEDLAGARNVLLAIGTGRLNLYDQPPRDGGRGAVHHLGVKVANLREVWRRLQVDGVMSKSGLREHAHWRYVMISAPDGVLVELFEFDDPLAPINSVGRV
jgi:catechol 2,3-dioxygenase-like lactoylglutathione lyase family enzyme